MTKLNIRLFGRVTLPSPLNFRFYDTSKQAVGALVIHFANIFLAEFFQGDPCTWYIVSFLLDSSLGLMFLFAGIRLTQHIARKRGWDALMFGEYGIPPEPRAWLAQCAVYVTLMLCEKVMVVLVIQLHFWERVRVFIMSPIRNPKVEVALVVLVIPFFINVFIFWVTDNFLMHKPRKMKRDKETSSPQARVFYRQDDLSASPECEVLLSGDDRSDGAVHHHRPTIVVK
ncbi:store-operated calcium entry regulator STIMATE-like isoform X2 [Ornithodoros turicata]|uniref:store-operated calcium entry regulator STIMATE-like isoform X2 n=1 Tax=Ornithodoros turicata TaxID=34597 RepID=UPI003138A093